MWGQDGSRIMGLLDEYYSRHKHEMPRDKQLLFALMADLGNRIDWDVTDDETLEEWLSEWLEIIRGNGDE